MPRTRPTCPDPAAIGRSPIMRYPKDSRGLVTLTRNALCAGEQGSLSPAALEAAGMSRRGKEKSPKPNGPRQNSAFLIWITASRRSWTAFVHPSPSVATDTPLMNLFTGTAPSRGRSTRLWSPATASSSRTVNSRRERSTDDLLRCDDSPMSPQTLACSVIGNGGPHSNRAFSRMVLRTIDFWVGCSRNFWERRGYLEAAGGQSVDLPRGFRPGTGADRWRMPRNGIDTWRILSKESRRQ